MEHLAVYERPELRDPVLVIAFGGWPDAGEGATGVVRYLVRKLSAKKFAEVLPEEFYDFTQTRPQTLISEEGWRYVNWPANEFFFWKDRDGARDYMFLVGIEPNLKWKSFASLVVGLAEQCGCKTVFHLGALLDAVPHTRAVRLTGSANKPEWRSRLEALKIHSSNYQGPTGISSAVMEACTSKGMTFASIWGHTPHYLQASPNFKVSYAILQTLNRILKLPVEMDELKANARRFDEAVQEAVSQDSQISAYVQRLEQEYDAAAASAGSTVPTPEDVVEELEEFLREERRRRGDEEPPEEK